MSDDNEIVEGEFTEESAEIVHVPGSTVQLEPSIKIKSLLTLAIRPPLIWTQLEKINLEIIALEIQSEELRQANRELVQQINRIQQ